MTKSKSFQPRWLLPGATFCILAACQIVGQSSAAADRPNIVWITSEDNGPYLGCYGDSQAHTPNLDRFAAEGVRYRNAFANAPVCSPARSTLLLGMYASTLGLVHHDSAHKIPNEFRVFAEYLQNAGYFCTNHWKTHCNFDRDQKEGWDVCGQTPQAHYRHRRSGQPFFAMFNIFTTHESQVVDKVVSAWRRNGRLPTETRLRPEDISLPPYHPDTPEFRRDWAVYYDNLTLMDREVGELLAELEREGVAEETIVFYFSDHGGALPRGKRFVYDTGTHVPLIIRFPEKWRHLAPAAPGEWVDELVSFIDFAPTALSLCGAAIPPHFEGRRFLGPDRQASPRYVHLFRDRMGCRYDSMRAIRDERFRYIRNYSPHRRHGDYEAYLWDKLCSVPSWEQAYKAGVCNDEQSHYWQQKPPEELYDLAADAHEVANLADDPASREVRDRLRSAMDEHLRETRDTVFVPEGMYAQIEKTQTVYDYVRGANFPFDEVHALANLASRRDPSNLPQLVRAMHRDHPVIRYWGASGCLILDRQAPSPAPELRTLLSDPVWDVRVVAAEALARLGDAASAFPLLVDVARRGSGYESLTALNSLDLLITDGIVERTAAATALRGWKPVPDPAHSGEYAGRLLKLIRAIE